METTGKRNKRQPNKAHAEKAFAAVLAISVICVAAVLITLYFVINSVYFEDSLNTDMIKDTIKDLIEPVDELSK